VFIRELWIPIHSVFARYYYSDVWGFFSLSLVFVFTKPVDATRKRDRIDMRMLLKYRVCTRTRVVDCTREKKWCITCVTSPVVGMCTMTNDDTDRVFYFVFVIFFLYFPENRQTYRFENYKSPAFQIRVFARYQKRVYYIRQNGNPTTRREGTSGVRSTRYYTDAPYTLSCLSSEIYCKMDITQARSYRACSVKPSRILGAPTNQIFIGCVCSFSMHSKYYSNVKKYDSSFNRRSDFGVVLGFARYDLYTVVFIEKCGI